MTAPLVRDGRARWRLAPWVLALGRPVGLRPGIVVPAELPACRALLHDIYIQEMGWAPPPGNPSGLRIAETCPPELVDDFDDRAIWLEVRAGPDLIATLRVIPPGPPGLEVTRYLEVPDPLLDGAMEVNRLAIRRGHRGGATFGLVALLLRHVARTLGARRALLAAERPIARRLYRPLGWRYTGMEFRYHADDPHPCELLALESGGAHLALSLTRTVFRAGARAVRLR